MTDDGALALANPTGNLELSEFVLMRSMRDRGVFDDRPLLESIGRHEIAAFALDADRLDVGWRGTDFFWPALRDAISRNYFPLLDEKGSPIGPPYLMIPGSASQSGH